MAHALLNMNRFTIVAVVSSGESINKTNFVAEDLFISQTYIKYPAPI